MKIITFLKGNKISRVLVINTPSKTINEGIFETCKPGMFYLVEFLKKVTFLLFNMTIIAAEWTQYSEYNG